MNGTVQVFVDLVRDLIGESGLGIQPEFRCEVLTDRDEINRGRRFQTSLYVELGKIDPATVGPDGFPRHDPYHLNSTYMATYRGKPGESGFGGEMVAFGRLIWRPSTTAADLRTDPCMIGGPWADVLLAAAPGKVAEEGSLAKKPGVKPYAVQKLHQRVLAFAEAHGVDYTVGCLEPRVYPFYKTIAGDGMQEMQSEPMLFPGILKPLLPVILDHTYRVNARRELREGVNPFIIAMRKVGLAYGLRVLTPALREVDYRHDDEIAISTPISGTLGALDANDGADARLPLGVEADGTLS